MKIVKHDNARMAFQQIEHVLMESGIAKMIQDAMVRMAILLEPGEITNRAIGVDPRIRHSWLRYDHVDVVMASKFRQQFDAVICDMAALRRQRRYVGKARPLICLERQMLRRYDQVFRVMRLQGAPGSPRAFLPTEFTSLLQAMLCETFPVTFLGQYPVQPFGHVFLIVRIE